MRSTQEFEVRDLVRSAKHNRNDMLNLRTIPRAAAPTVFAVKFTSVTRFAPDKILRRPRNRDSLCTGSFLLCGVALRRTHLLHDALE